MREVLYNIVMQCGIYMNQVMLIKMCLNKIYREVSIDRYLSDTFPVRNVQNGNDLLPFLFSFALEYVTRKVQEGQVGLKLNLTHKMLVLLMMLGKTEN
jgi:hypothetical protein